MICKRCGKEFSNGSFCPSCGAPAVEAESQSNDVTGVVSYDEPTVFDASEEATVIDSGKLTETADSDAMVAARDFDATVAAPVLGVNGVPKAESDKKSAKKANKEPKPLKKKIIAAVAAVLAVVIALGAVAAGVVAFTPKYKLMLALGNTLLDTKSFEFDVSCVYESYFSYGEVGYGDTCVDVNVKGAVAFGKTTPETSLYFQANIFEKYEGIDEYEDGYYDEYTGEYITEMQTDAFCNESEGTVYAVSDAGEALAGYVDKDDREGIFLEGDIVKLVEYGENNIDEIIRKFGISPSEFRKDFEEYASIDIETAIEWAKSLISKNKVNEDVIEDAFNTILREYLGEFERIDLPEYKEAKKLVADFLMNGLSKDAVKITDTRIEDGMTKYDISVNIYEVIRSFVEFAEKNEALEDFLNDIDDDLLDEIDNIRKSDIPGVWRDDIEFTIGTKNMRIVHMNFDLNVDADNGMSIEINFTNINKKLEFSGYYSDVESVAANWKDNCYRIETVDDLDRWL